VTKDNNNLEVMSGFDSAFYRNIMEQARDIILVMATDGEIIDINLAALHAYGYSRDELRKICIQDLRSPETRIVVDAQLKRAQQEGVLFRTVHMRNNGEYFPVEVSSRPFHFMEREAVVSIVRDITEAVAKETALKKGEESFRVLNEQLMMANEELTASEEELRQQFDELLIKEEKISQYNTVLHSLHETALGLMNRLDLEEVLRIIVSSATQLLGTQDGYINLVDKEKDIFVRKVAVGQFAQDMTRQTKVTEGLLGQAYITGEITVLNDYSMWKQRLPAPIFDGIDCAVVVPLKDGDSVVGAIGLGFAEPGRTLAPHEIFMLQRFAAMASIALDNATLVRSYKDELRERMKAEATVRHMAYHDDLTGLPNRRYLQECLAHELESARQRESMGAILFVDMDDFKMINDTLGYSYGDRVIIKAGEYLRAQAGDDSVVARIGGDEFIALLPNVNDREKVAHIADNMVKLLSRDYEIGVSKTHMSASIGIALYPLDGDTAEEIFKNADLALYAAKGNGKNTWRFYDPKLQKIAYENMILKRDLREAIGREELSLHYQPLVDAKNGNVISFEALLRWTTSGGEAIPPGRFIPLAEENDTINIIGKWVIEEACRFICKLTELGKGNIRVSVNVSPRQLVADDFVPNVRAAIVSAGIKPSQLEIEITESALIASLGDSIIKLGELRAIGVCLSLDDFGTGYSSLTYLRRLPVGMLKIDKSFIDQIAVDEAQLQFICSIINMAHVLELTVVAEGVESEEQLKKLVECKCDFIQGYFIRRPASESEAILFLDR